MPPAVAAVATFVTTVIVGATGASLVAAAIIHSVVSFVLKALIVMAISAAVSMLTKKPKNTTGNINQGAELKLKLDPTMPRQIVVGINATGGSVAWAHTHTPAGSKIPNECLKRVIVLSDVPSDSLVGVKLGTETLTFDGALTHGVRRACTSHFQTKAGADNMHITFYNGSQTTADPTMVAGAPGLWTESHIGYGLTYVVVEYLSDPDAFPNGEPELAYIVKGAACYDDRKDGSKPGRTGDHRVDDPDTWEWTDNAGVIAAQVMRGFYNPHNPDVLMYGVQAEDRDLSDAMLLSCYNTCDQDVDLVAGGTENRYRANLNLNANEAVYNVLQDLQAAFDGRIIDRGGAITLLPGATRTPVLDITDDDIVWTEQRSWQPKASLEELTNFITGTFVDGEGGTFAEKAFPTLSNPTWEVDDGGERFITQVSFRAVHSWTQVQRITKRMHNTSRQQATVAFVMPIWGIEMEQGDWFTLSSSRWGITDMYFEVQQIHLTQDLKVAIIGRQVDPDDDIWVPASDEVPRSDTFWNPSSSNLPIPVFVLTPTAIEQGDIKIPAVLFYQEDSNLAQETQFIEVQVALDGFEDTGPYNTLPLMSAVEGTNVLAYTWLPNTEYQVRARNIGFMGRVSDWSPWEAVITTADFIINLLTGLGDLATLDQVEWATQVTGVGKPEDFANLVTIYRQATAPVAPNTNDIWVETASGVPIAIWVWNGTIWVKGADITGINIAAGFTGQGPLATSTLTEAEVYNALWKFGSVNLFRKVDWTPSGSAAATALPGYGRAGYGWTLAGGAVSSVVRSTRAGYALSPTGVEHPYSPSFLAKITTGSGTATLRAGWRTPGGATISDVADVSFTVTTTPLQFAYNNVTSNDSNFITAEFRIFSNSGDIGSGKTVTITDLMMEHANGHSLDWRPSPDDVELLRYATYVGSLDADKTSVNTAAGISGQGALATQNAATWATQVTGSGKPENNADVTSTHTAAAITGQGGLATLNNVSTLVAPGTGLSANTVGNVTTFTNTAMGTSVFYLTISAASISAGRSGAGTVTTGSVTVTPHGHTGSASYQWLGSNGISPTAPTNATTAFTGFVGLGQEKEATIICQAADSGTGQTATIGCSVLINETS